MAGKSCGMSCTALLDFRELWDLKSICLSGDSLMPPLQCGYVVGRSEPVGDMLGEQPTEVVGFAFSQSRIAYSHTVVHFQ
jgi:hypothetical protein